MVDEIPGDEDLRSEERRGNDAAAQPGNGNLTKEKLAEHFEAYRPYLKKRASQIFAGQRCAAEHVEECLQETFIDAMKRLVDYDPSRSTVHCWIYVILRSVAINVLRRTVLKDGQPVELPPDLTAPNEEHAVIEDEMKAHIDKCKSTKLSAVERDVVNLRFEESLTFSDIAAVLAIPLGTALTTCSRGILKIKECLERKGYH